MRTLLKFQFPVEAANQGIKDGTLPRTVEGFIQQHKPEAAYFFAEEGLRTALFVFDLKDTSDIPSIAEPFFMTLNAAVSATPVMNAEDLKTGLGRLAGRQ